jgi:hypothetical protein
MRRGRIYKRYPRPRAYRGFRGVREDDEVVGRALWRFPEAIAATVFSNAAIRLSCSASGRVLKNSAEIAVSSSANSSTVFFFFGMDSLRDTFRITIRVPLRNRTEVPTPHFYYTHSFRVISRLSSPERQTPYLQNRRVGRPVRRGAEGSFDYEAARALRGPPLCSG